jgi:4-amino-4-deoxy-L-arabinose transferase-like glycosyltransferase
VPSAPITAPGDRIAVWLRAGAPYLLVVAVGLASRLKYALVTYHDTLASGDAHLILTKALFVSRGEWRPPVELGGPSTIFSDPPLIALLLGGAEKATSLPMIALAATMTSLLTIAALCALYAVARRAFDPLTAVIGVCLVALLPRFSMDSTEPDKAIYVVSFSIIALYFLYAAQTRPRLYLAAGAFIGLAAFSHTTGYIFLGVYGLSHIAITRGTERRLLDRWFIAGLIIPLVMIAAYVQLNDEFQRSAVTATPVATADAAAQPSGAGAASPSQAPVLPPPAPSNDHRFVPGSIQLYYDNITGLAKRGFEGSAWNRYFDAIRTQTTTPIYVLAVLGFAAAGALVVSRRRFDLLPLMLWMMLVTLAFAIQHPALSHRTRYPTYVTPVFVLFAVFAVVTAARALLSRTDAAMRGWYVAAAIAPVVALVGASYAMSNAAGQRKLYAPHDRMAAYISQRALLGDDNELLYMAWPSVTIALLEDHPADEPFLHTYGWGSSPVSKYTSGYVESQGIRYFAYDHTGSDYYQTSQSLFAQLGTQFTLKRMVTFCGTDQPSQRDPASCGASYTVLYELLPKS